MDTEYQGPLFQGPSAEATGGLKSYKSNFRRVC